MFHVSKMSLRSVVDRSGRASVWSYRVGHLRVDLCGDAGQDHIQVDVVLLVQAQVAVAHQVQGVDTPASRGTKVINSSWLRNTLHVATHHINTRSPHYFSIVFFISLFKINISSFAKKDDELFETPHWKRQNLFNFFPHFYCDGLQTLNFFCLSSLAFCSPAGASSFPQSHFLPFIPAPSLICLASSAIHLAYFAIAKDIFLLHFVCNEVNLWKKTEECGLYDRKSVENKNKNSSILLCGIALSRTVLVAPSTEQQVLPLFCTGADPFCCPSISGSHLRDKTSNPNLLSSLLRSVEGHLHSRAVAHVSHPLDSQQLLAVHLPDHHEPALVLHFGEPWGLGFAVLFPLKSVQGGRFISWTKSGIFS